MFVEAQETFEAVLLPTPEDFFKVLIVPGKDRATVIISDGEKDRSTYTHVINIPATEHIN